MEILLALGGDIDSSGSKNRKRLSLSVLRQVQKVNFITVQNTVTIGSNKYLILKSRILLNYRVTYCAV